MVAKGFWSALAQQAWFLEPEAFNMKRMDAWSVAKLRNKAFLKSCIEACKPKGLFAWFLTPAPSLCKIVEQLQHKEGQGAEMYSYLHVGDGLRVC